MEEEQYSPSASWALWRSIDLVQMIHNFVKYIVKTRLCLWDIKITNFKPESRPDDLLEIYYFYISQMNSSLDKIFYKVVYHHIIYICDFFVNLDDFFTVVCTGFHKSYGFHQIRFRFERTESIWNSKRDSNNFLLSAK